MPVLEKVSPNSSNSQSNLPERCYNYQIDAVIIFTSNEQTEAEAGQVTCPRSHNQEEIRTEMYSPCAGRQTLQALLAFPPSSPFLTLSLLLASLPPVSFFFGLKLKCYSPLCPSPDPHVSPTNLLLLLISEPLPGCFLCP